MSTLYIFLKINYLIQLIRIPVFLNLIKYLLVTETHFIVYKLIKINKISN